MRVAIVHVCNRQGERGMGISRSMDSMTSYTVVINSFISVMGTLSSQWSPPPSEDSNVYSSRLMRLSSI